MAFISLNAWPNGIPLATITLTANQKPFVFVLDTGSTLSHINEETVNSKLKVPIEPSEEELSTTGINGEITSKGVIRQLFHTRMFSFEHEFAVSDLSALVQTIKESSNLEIDGLIGMDFLIKYRCHIDFKKNRLHFD